MTTYVQARTAVVTLIETAWTTQYPAIPIFFENTKQVDLDTVGSMFLKVFIDFDDAVQLTINNDPKHMTFGTLRLTIVYKEGTGTLKTLEVMDFLTNLAKFKLNTSVTFWLPVPGRKVSQKGWESQDLEVPFRFHNVT